MGNACGKNKPRKQDKPGAQPGGSKPEPSQPHVDPNSVNAGQYGANPQTNAQHGSIQNPQDPNLNIQGGSGLQQVNGQQQFQGVNQQYQTNQNVSLFPTISGNTDPKEAVHLANLYLFGIDSDETSKIVKINPKLKSVETIHPPSNLELFNLSGIVYLNDREIFVTGGLSSTLKASNSAYLYNAQLNTAVALPPFAIARYSHVAIIFKHKLFIIGGFPTDSDDKTILRSVEFLPLNSPTPTWTSTGDLNHPRACGFAMIYNDRLYVAGGYAGTSRRPKYFEVYNEETNRWEITDFKLPRGVEYPILSAADRDELLIIGGNVRGAVIRSNIQLNLKTKSYISKRSMHKERVFHKAIQDGPEIWVVGGDEKDTVEVYDSIRDEWRYEDLDYKRHLKDIRSFSAALAPFVLTSKKDLPDLEVSKSSKTDIRAFLFGDDITPFILEINFTKKFTKEKPIPVGLKLFAYQNIVSLEDGRYFLCNGLSQHGQHPVSHAYIYDPDKNEVKKCAKSKIPSYVGNIVKKGNHIYLIGGHSWKDENEIILNTCERYNILTDTWEMLPNLNHGRCSGMSFVFGDKVVVMGGFRGEYERWGNAEVLDEALGRWQVVNVFGLPPLEGAGVLRDPIDKTSILIFQGVTNEYDAQKVWKMSHDFKFQELKGSIKEKRHFAKVCAVDGGVVCLLGGERLLVEFFDLQKGDDVQNDFSMEIESALTKMLSIEGQADKSLKSLGFA